MSDMRKLMEAIQPQEVLEGKYGPMGGRRATEKVDAIFDKHIDRLGSEPTIEEIYDAVRAVKGEMGQEDLITALRTPRFINKQFVGAVAEKLELPGLYGPSGKTFYSTDTDSAGRYIGSGRASRSTNQELARQGYLSAEAAERLGVTRFLGMEFGDGDSDEVNAIRSDQETADSNRQVRRDVARFNELLAKRNATENEGMVYESALARLLTEALSDEEEAEFQELLSRLRQLDPIEDEETQAAVQSALDAMPEPAAEPEATPATSNDSNTPLADFAQSGKGGIKNDRDETDAITKLQEFLKTMGWDIGVDGAYGPQTTSAVKEFQQLVGITDDGDAGPETIGNILTWGQLPDVKTWAPQLKELTDLIAAGATFTPPATESISFSSMRSMIAVLESLNEEVSDQQQARAMELYTALKTKIEGGADYVGSLPEVLQTQISSAAEWAVTTPDDGEGDTATATITAERATQIATDFAARGGLGSSDNGTLGHVGLGHSTDEQGINDRLKELQNAADWQLVVDAYTEVGSSGRPLRTGDLIKDMMGSLDAQDYQQYIAGELRRIGIEPGAGTGSNDDEAPSDGGDGSDTVNARPGGIAGANWDQRYGYTHNRDGSRKSDEEIAAAAAARAQAGG
jgi:peptidoglycan hydrolase-like protein with peptidoglycan-binding domain